MVQQARQNVAAQASVSAQLRAQQAWLQVFERNRAYRVSQLTRELLEQFPGGCSPGWIQFHPVLQKRAAQDRWFALTVMERADIWAYHEIMRGSIIWRELGKGPRSVVIEFLVFHRP